MYKVSVVVPVYNEEKHLKECLESIRNQTLEEIEVIMVDDGSIDIFNEYVQMDDRLLLIKQQNQYAGVVRNNGIKKAFLYLKNCIFYFLWEGMGYFEENYIIRSGQ